MIITCPRCHVGTCEIVQRMRVMQPGNLRVWGTLTFTCDCYEKKSGSGVEEDIRDTDMRSRRDIEDNMA